MRLRVLPELIAQGTSISSMCTPRFGSRALRVRWSIESFCGLSAEASVRCNGDVTHPYSVQSIAPRNADIKASKVDFMASSPS